MRAFHRGGAGEALNLDLKDFGTLLYQLLLELAVDGGANMPLALGALEAWLLKQRQLSDSRVAAFVKRLASQLLHTSSAGTLSGLAQIHQLLQVGGTAARTPRAARAPRHGAGWAGEPGGQELIAASPSARSREAAPDVRACPQRYARAQLLLDTEQTALGIYLPEAADPDMCQPLATALWEVALLRRHYHPTVAKLAQRVAAGDAGVAGRPQAIFRQFDTAAGAFNPAVRAPPPQPLAQRAPGTAVWRAGRG